MTLKRYSKIAFNVSEIKLGGTGCSTTLPDSCDGQNTNCPSGTCVCETGYYDSDGDGESGTCLASKYHRRLVQISINYPPLTITKTVGEHFSYCKLEKKNDNSILIVFVSAALKEQWH